MKNVPALIFAIVCTLVACQPLSAADDPTTAEAKSIVGYWQCTEFSYKGKSKPKLAGDVYWFKADGEVEINFADGAWSRWDYRLDATTKPKELKMSWAGGKWHSTIYDLTEDRLRTREADDPQPLSFDHKPTGIWNEMVFKRISAAEAQVQIKKLKDKSRD